VIRSQNPLTAISPDCPDPPPTPGTPVQAACGAWITYSNATPCINLLGQPIYFCNPECKQKAIENPRASCMSTLYTMEFE